MWAWLIAIPDQPIYIPLRIMLRYHRRPVAEALSPKGTYK